jgi:hypothetical protein
MIQLAREPRDPAIDHYTRSAISRFVTSLKFTIHNAARTWGPRSSHLLLQEGRDQCDSRRYEIKRTMGTHGGSVYERARHTALKIHRITAYTPATITSISK